MPAAAPTSDYMVARTPAETARLKAQSTLLEAPTASVLDQLSIPAGARCLDVGCGAGGVSRMLAQRVGEHGSVIGLDVDADLGRRSFSELAAESPAHCEFIHGDLLGTTTFSHAPFDLVWTRLVMLHMHDPAIALERMWSWTAPGGHVAMLEPDLTSLMRADHPWLREFGRIGTDVAAASGCDPRIGTTLPGLFASVGLGKPDGTLLTGVVLPFGELVEYLAATFRGVSAAGVRLGVFDERRALEFMEEGAAAAKESDEYTIGPLFVASWKRKPVVRLGQVPT